jgi:AraC-like DNA-binding protein
MTHLIRMFEYYSRGERKSKRILRHLVVLMLCELVRPARSSDTSSTLEGGLESIASRVDAYIAAHYNRDKATNDIAMALHYNPHYLERVYRAERGISIREAIQVRRIQEARAQLRLQRTDGVAKIAARCGYSDVAYFRRLFKRATGATPQEYRTAHALLAIPWNERDMHHD